MLKIVIIDDEKWSTDYMRGLIDWEENGAEIVGEFNNASEALEFLKDNHDVDLVFADVEMPKMSGIELLCTVNKDFPNIAFVFISSHDNFEYVSKALRYHAKDYLLKPVDKSDVLRILKNVKKDGENAVEGIAKKTQVGVFFEDYNNRASDIWKDTPYNLTVCCVSETIDEAIINFVKQFFDAASIYCYRSVYYNSFFIKTDKESLDIFLEAARSGSQYRFGVYFTENENEKLKNMLINAQNAYDGLWFCPNVSICVYEKNIEKILMSYIDIVSKHLEAGALQESQESIDDFMEELKINRLQGSVGVLFVNKLIERLVMRFDYSRDILDYTLIDVSHAKKQFITVDRLVDFLHSLIYEYEPDKDSMQNLKAKDFVPMIKRYIEDNYSGNINLTVLSKEFMISSKYLSRVFKETEGININRYITLVRINKAMVMLKETAISVQDIAYLCGYENNSYFTKIFREIAGETPVEYRQNNQAVMR